MKVIIDRFEEDIAVVELDGKMYDAPRALFADAHEGDAAAITVLPRENSTGDTVGKEDKPAAIFAKLRRKKRRR